MRNSTRLRFLFAFASTAALAAGFLACSGSDEQDVITPDAGKDTGPRPEASAPVDSGVVVPKEAGPDAEAGPQYDAGPSTVLEAGAEYEGGIACVVGGRIEEEINDTPDAANAVSYTHLTLPTTERV